MTRALRPGSERMDRHGLVSSGKLMENYTLMLVMDRILAMALKELQPRGLSCKPGLFTRWLKGFLDDIRRALPAGRCPPAPQCRRPLGEGRRRHG